MTSERSWTSDDLFGKVREIEALLPQLEQFAAVVSTELSGIDVSTRMFQRLGGMWLMHLAHQIAAHPTSTRAQSINTVLTIPADGYSHHRGFTELSSFRRQLVDVSYSDLTQYTDRSLKMTQFQIPVPPRRRSSRVLERFIRLAANDSCPVMASHPYLKVSRMGKSLAAVKSREQIVWCDPQLTDLRTEDVDQRRRLSLALAVSGEDLFARTCRAVSLMLPVSYGESLHGHVESLTKRYEQPRLLYSANGSQFQLAYQVLSAVWGESGTRILSHQHGGHQGLDDVHAGEEYEIRASDRHYTLGWKDSRANAVPLSTAMPRRSDSTSSGRLLLMSLSASDVVYRLQPFCVPSHVHECITETKIFLMELKWSEDAIVRCDTPTIEQLSSHQSDVKWEPPDPSGSVSASMSALVVHNYLGASWLETLAMDIPTVCFIPKNIHRFRDAAQPFVEALIRVGILHYSGRDAARFVNSLNGDPSGWWNSAEVQEARQAFVARYANFSDNWLEAWMTEFERMLSE